MDEDTLTGLSQRDEAFWVGLTLLFGGLAIPDGIALGGQELNGVVVACGAIVLTVRLLVGIVRLLGVAASAGIDGYRSGRNS
jgi:hypothetical protein